MAKQPLAPRVSRRAAALEAWRLVAEYDVVRHAHEAEPDDLEHQMALGAIHAHICDFLLRQGHPD